MELLFLIGGIIWAIVSYSAKKAQDQKKAANRPPVQRGGAQQSAPVRPAPPTVRPARPAQPARPVIQEQRKADKPAASLAEGEGTVVLAGGKQPLQTRTRVAVASQLTEISHTEHHTLETSFSTGHAHEETSMTGEAGECPPELKVVRPAPAAPTSTATRIGDSVFAWDQNAVLAGLVYSEILGKPKALRQAR